MLSPKHLVHPASSEVAESLQSRLKSQLAKLTDFQYVDFELKLDILSRFEGRVAHRER